MAKIKDYLGKLKALAPAYAQPNYDNLVKDLLAVQASSVDFDVKQLIKDLQAYVNDTSKLISTMRVTTARQHQVDIRDHLNKLIKTFKSGKGTFQALFEDFYLYIENKLALDV